MDPLQATVSDTLARVRERLTEALAEQGFGILTRIDLQATLREKLGVERGAHEILGVCNPKCADAALRIDPDVALLLPCNVTLRDVEGNTEVRILDPAGVFALAGEESRGRLEPLAQSVRRRLATALRTTASVSHEEGVKR